MLRNISAKDYISSAHSVENMLKEESKCETSESSTQFSGDDSVVYGSLIIPDPEIYGSAKSVMRPTLNPLVHSLRW